MTLNKSTLRGQAALRLGAALLLSTAAVVVLVIFGFGGLEARRQDRLAEQISAQITYRLELHDLERLRNARQIATQIEIMRIMDAAPALRNDRLLGLFTALGQDLGFDTVGIRDEQGRSLFSYGHEIEEVSTLRAPAAVGGYYSARLNDYHRMICLPLWTGQGRGQIVFLARVDNGMLTGIAPLGTVLRLRHGNGPLAESLVSAASVAGTSSASAMFAMNVYGDPDLSLQVTHSEEPLLSRGLTLSLAAITALLLAAALWWVLGRWLSDLGARVAALSAACAAFPQVRAVDADIQGHLDRAQWPDEVGAVAATLERMMHEVEQTEQRLRQSEQRWLRALDGSSLGVWDRDVNTNKVYFSHRWKAMLGFADDEIGNDFHEWSDRVHPDDMVACMAELESHFRGKTPFYRNEHRMRRKDGTWCWILDQGMVFERTSEGAPLRVVGTHTDITERRAFQAELVLHRDHLEELVLARTAELSTTRDEARRLAQVKSEFLANMSHEIRTPLNAVLGLAQIGVLSSTGQATLDTFSRIRDSGQHLLGVINDVLDFSRLDAGKLVVEPRPFALRAVIGRASGLIADAAHAKGLAFEVSTAPDLHQWVSGDDQRLTQILANLLSNAVKFSDSGSVCLRVARQGDDTLFEVSDSGIGMTPEQLERLFQPFEQADGSTARRFGGSGLGLAISRNLARLMDGEITVQSQPGAGSTFSLRIALQQAQPEPAEPHVPSADPAARAGSRLIGLRILAAEDVEVNRLVLDALLEHEGAMAMFAESGQHALDLLQERGAHSFDVVLMDVQMPVMDGYEATRRLCRMAPGLPVIGLTAHALAEERDKCRAAGMVEHITKPIDMDALVAAILRQVV